MDVKDLRKAYRQNDKQINDLLAKYSARYTTKANQAIYKLMVIALRAELQNILYNLKFEKLEKSIDDIKDVTHKYLEIAGNGNQSIAGTLTKFIGEISWNNGEVTECIFTFVHTVRQKKYVQIQFHRIESGGVYVIENSVLECIKGSAEGRELTEKEWKQLKPFANLAARTETGFTKPQFVIDRLNITNNADECNPMGIAIFANAIDTLKKLDMEYDSYCNEFDLGRKRIFVAPEMLTNEDGSPTFDPDDSVFYSLPEDYDKSQTGLIKEVDMSLRVEQHSKAINDDLNYLSLKCGFGTERYRFDGAGAKTATEIISENSDMYRMLKKHEIILEDVLKRLIRIIIRLGQVTGNVLDPDTEITIDFDDSIIEDKDSERQQDRQDVSMGVMRLEEYRAKWYGETVEQARQNLPEQNQVME